MRERLLLSGVLLLLILSTGCGSLSAYPKNAANTSSQNGTASIQNSSIKTNPASLTKAQVLNAYDRAVTAVKWFQSGNMPCSDETVRVDDTIYRKVKYAGIETMEDLKTYLRGIFSEELVEKLTGSKNQTPPRFRDVQGSLYEMRQEAKNEDSWGRVKLLVKKSGSARYIVNVTAELMAKDRKTVKGVECNSFPYERINGRWVFTNFELPD